MGRDTDAGRAGRGGNSGRGGHGRRGRGRGANATVPRKASEVGACKELEGRIFTIVVLLIGVGKPFNLRSESQH